MTSIQFGNNLAQMAVNNFMSSGSLATQGAQTLAAPVFNQLGSMGSSFSAFGFAASSFGFGNTGAMNPGFLSPPMGGMGAGFGQMPGAMNAMQGPWNMMGNLLSGGMGNMGGGPKIGGLMGGLQRMMGGIARMMNTLMPMMQMMQQMQQMKQAASMGKGQAQMPGLQTGQPGIQGGTPGKPAAFPGKAGSNFLNSLPTNRRALARTLNVSGRRDEQRIQQAAGMLKTAAPKITPGTGAAGKGKLQLTPADVQAIRSAPNPAAAKKKVLDIISKKTGVNVNNLNMRNKRGIRSNNYRNALNKLLGTKVRAGREKNSGSALAIDSIAESVANSVRGGNFGTSQVQSPGKFAFASWSTSGSMSSMGAAGGMAQMTGMEGGQMTNAWSGGFANTTSFSAGGFAAWHVPGQMAEVPNPASGLNVDLSAFTGAANKVGELASPLIFDLEGTGLELKGNGMIEVDIDGDGKKELVTDLDAETGLLVFESKDESLQDITGADMFGDNTDLTRYGITAPTEDGSFKDGFQALRAVCEHFNLVNEEKQFLDAGDLNFLQTEIGLRMRVGGITDGEDRTFAEIGVTEINLGNPNQTQHIDDAPEDRWGNKIMYQDGATFTVYTEVRKYADIWFKIQARYDDALNKEELSVPKVDFMNIR